MILYRKYLMIICWYNIRILKNIFILFLIFINNNNAFILIFKIKIYFYHSKLEIIKWKRINNNRI